MDLDRKGFDEFIKDNEVCVVDFWAAWCGPCLMLAPKLEEACKEKGIPLGKINIDEYQGLAQDFGVMSIPCVVLFKRGEEADRSIGNVSKESLLKFLG